MDNRAICAIATPVGVSALGIIRVSGPQLHQKIDSLFDKKLRDREATYVNFIHQEKTIDQCVAIFYEAPRSYTGEDMLEIISHGNSIIMNSIMRALQDFGVQQAEPGEFTKRAFMNNKIDLTQAEAVADLISASSIQSVKAANNSLSGQFARDIETIQDSILGLRSLIESVINFPEEDDVSSESLKDAKNDLQKIILSIQNLQKHSINGLMLNFRPTYAVIGKPNSGKSSLINALLREDASIVTEVEGTTRDSIKYSLCLNNQIINLVDTAGLRETNDLAEEAGIARTFTTASKSEKIIYMIDDQKGMSQEDEIFLNDYSSKNCYLIFNKIDMTGKQAKIIKNNFTEIHMSVKKNLGLDLFKNVILDDLSNIDYSENTHLARERHLELLSNASNHLEQCRASMLNSSLEICAEELRLAHLALSSILGQNSSEELLNRIFTTFCIGK